MYTHDWHHSAMFHNKESNWNGFLCLYLSDEGVEILPQYNTYEPQIITYNMLGDKLDKHTIHTILTWISSLYGAAKTQGSLLLSQLEPYKNP